MIKQKLRKIIEYYGVISQLKYFQSEIFELNEAIIKQENKNSLISAIERITTGKNEGIRNIAEEIADVLVMLEQFKLYYGISNNEIADIVKYKVDRQIKRIEDAEKKV